MPESGAEEVPIPTTFVLKRCENASKYKIEIAADPEFTDIVHTIETTSSVVTTDELLYDTEYYARVTTKEYLGDGKIGEVISFHTQKQPVPDKPLENVKLTNDIDAVLVQWDPVDKSYVNVFRKAKDETEFTMIAENVSGNGYLDSQVEAGKTYTYVVIPVNTSGEGPASEEMSVTVKEPEILFADDFDNGTISDLWTDAAGNQVNVNPDDAVVEDGQWVPSGSWKEYYVGISNAEWTDYAVEADITFNGMQEGAEDYSAFGLITRANYNGGKQFYQFLIRSRQTVMELQKCDGNYWTMLKQVDTGKEPQPGDIYRMRFESIGNISRMYLNGILFAEFEDNSYMSGGIGIGYGKDNISIDNVRVCRAKTGEEPEEPEEPEKPSDKTLLQKSYDYAVALNTDGVVDSAKAYFEKVLAEAQAVLEDETATQEEVNTAWNNLLGGIWGLGIYQGDKTNLNLLIETAEAMTAEADRYVTEKWDLLTAALEEAKAVAADGDALEEDITPAADALLDAILAQRYKADKSNLKNMITKTESMDLSGYTEESVAVVNRALVAAYTVLEDESLGIDDQTEVENAVMNLEKAVAALEKADYSEGGSEGENAGDDSTDNGAGTGDNGSTTGNTGNENTGNNGGTSDDANKGNGSGAGSGSDGKEGSSDGKSAGTEMPKTGDGMNCAAAAAGMMALSVAVAAIAVLRFRKRQ